MAAPLRQLVHTRILYRLSRKFTLQAKLVENTNGGVGQRLPPVSLDVCNHGQAARARVALTRQYSRRAQPHAAGTNIAEHDSREEIRSEDDGAKRTRRKSRKKKDSPSTAAGTNVTEHDSREEIRSEDDGKKRTRRKTRKKKDSPSTSAPRTESGITLNFPFEGERKEVDATTNTNTGTLTGQESSSFTTHIVNQSGGRVYSIHREGEVYHLPSVTTILGSTLPEERRFMLLNWKQSLVKKRGEGGYREVVDKTRVLGIQFHEVGCGEEV